MKARRVTGLSDRSIVWLFISPTILLLLAINIFPLIWAIRLSFTGFMANLPHPASFIGIDNYVDILTDEDVWQHFQSTAHFVFWTIALQVLVGLGLALLDQPEVSRSQLLDDRDPVADDAVACRGRQLLDLAAAAADRTLQLFHRLFHRLGAELVHDDRQRRSGALDNRNGQHLDVDALRDADLPGRAALHSRLYLRSSGDRSRVELASVLVDHVADGHAISHARGAVSGDPVVRDVRPGQSPDFRRPGIDDRARIDHTEARGVREMGHRLRVGARRHPVRHGVSGPPTSM